MYPICVPDLLKVTEECLDIACRNDKEAIILDFFGGSGTTGHAAINLNRLDNGNRKYILVEMRWSQNLP